MRLLALVVAPIFLALLSIACGDDDARPVNEGLGIVDRVDGAGRCGTRINTPATQRTGVPSDAPIDPRALPSAQDLAARLDIAVNQVEVAAVDPATWCNSCLGVHFAGASCLAQLTPGYLIFLQVADKTYRYHTSGQGPGIGIEFLEKSDDFVYEE